MGSFYGYSQKYKITYSATAQAEPCNPDPIEISYHRIFLRNTNTNQSFLLASAHCNNLIDSKINAVAIIDFLPNIISDNIYARTIAGNVILDEGNTVNVNYNHCDSKTTYVSTFSNTVKVDIEPYTEINPKPPGNPCVITLNVDQDGFLPEVYVWQYYDFLSTAIDKWTNFPAQFQGKHTITFEPIDIFGNKTSDYLNKTINFRMQKYCTGKYTEVRSYAMISCSPQLQEPVVTQSTSCNYKADGTLTLNFDRKIESEELVMTLYDGTDDNLIYDQEFTSTLTNNSGVYSYTWNKPLDAGSYRVKYQTHTGTGGIDQTDSTWNSLEFSNPFTITAATPVNFNITSSADQNCFAINDGYIEVSATGEPNRTFLYQLTKNGELQIFNGVDWIQYTGNNEDNDTWFQFANASTTRINNLNKGAYKIKVKDSQGCFAKQ
ncbi:hypothetical protein P8625_02380 [Tenacibaculum tangerinum]|uniref:Uncharacterized protein n=1 Tax=Tenacibaculum tangerinum TaxID=3038772 RepID=A0ABY8L4M7_9FLAO|nr:hypothetical protein [Tenacibaculum tangerinum]WGH76036.1 hypothetical protein P8625_02380 [Tenacibaculum tangerinum]